MARVCSRSGCISLPDRPVGSPARVSSGAPGVSPLRPEDVDAFIRRQQARPARLLLEQGQPLPPQLQPYEAEARAQMEQPAINQPALPQPDTTLAQKVKAMGQADFDPIEQYYKQQFATQTIPQLAERFTGNKESSAFTGALGAAGSQLNTNLALLRAQYDLALRDQMIRMANIQGRGQLPGSPTTPGWGEIASEAIRTAVPTVAGALGGPIAGALAQGGVNVYNRFFGNNQPSTPNYAQAIAPDQQLLGSRLASGYATPQDIQRFQAATGLGGSAASDFANTFRQPGSQAAMMDQNLNRFKQFTTASPGTALQYLGIRS